MRSTQIKQLNNKVDKLVGTNQTPFKPVPFYVKESGKFYLEEDGNRIEVAEPKGIDQPGFSAIIFCVPEPKIETE
ncbi:MAG: hypothetical protein NUV69_04510 [Candidatus Curtissbacteria bacterium]|nr:hypothetical protein [Candidatus Curtissbacteria bacterium]